MLIKDAGHFSEKRHYVVKRQHGKERVPISGEEKKARKVVWV